MDYPQDFPAESRARVEAALIRAGRQFDSKKPKVQWRSDVEKLFWTYVLAPFLVFAQESSRQALWPADEMDRKCREFLRRRTIEAHCERGIAAGLSDPIDNFSCGIRWAALQEIEKTSQWRKYQSIRLKYSLGQSSDARNSNKTKNRERKSTDNSLMVDAYIEEVRKRKAKRITRKDIWKGQVIKLGRNLSGGNAKTRSTRIRLPTRPLGGY